MKKFVLILSALMIFALSGCGGGEKLPEASPVPEATASPEPTATPEPTPSPTPEPTATPEPTPEPVASELTGEISVVGMDGYGASRLLDSNVYTHGGYNAGYRLHVESETPVYSVYFSWYKPCTAYTIELENRIIYGGEHGFLHDYIDFDEPVTSFDIIFDQYAELCDIRAFTDGRPPEDVQVWQPPLEKADVLLLPAHADDDVIFLGALAAQCVDRGLGVQVCYLVHHYNWQPRPHELLNALWTMGIRNYPVIGPFEDYYVLSLEEALYSFGEKAVVDYYVGLIREFRPSVIATLDREGEYGHGAHRICALAAQEAVELAAQPDYDEGTAELYGVWDTPKLYLHMAPENEIWLDVETPLEHFNGMTAFEVAQAAMNCHQSQLQYAHRPTLASEDFPRYDCRRFGLVRTLVGPDTGNDVMENIPADVE